MLTRNLLITLCFACLETSLEAAPLPDAARTPRSIDPETIAAYEKLGAKYGGFVDDGFGRVMFSPGKEAADKGLPGFYIRSLKNRLLFKLPPIQVPVGSCPISAPACAA
jgi:hypothetical protein